MPSLLLHHGATVVCAHGGYATPTVANPRVAVSGQATALLSGPWTVAGCALPPGSGGPCVTAQWTRGTLRVTSNSQPLVVMDEIAICAPTGTPLLAVSAQTRVRAQ
jgi:hypothetical protein